MNLENLGNVAADYALEIAAPGDKLVFTSSSALWCIPEETVLASLLFCPINI